jgi:four helix bundle protein
MIKSYKDLFIWQKSVDLTVNIYQVTKKYPKSEIFGLISQIRRCCSAIPANIAEGQTRGHILEYKQFLRIALSSGAELDTHLLISWKIGYITETEYLKLIDKLTEIMKMIRSLSKNLEPKT